MQVKSAESSRVEMLWINNELLPRRVLTSNKSSALDASIEIFQNLFLIIVYILAFFILKIGNFPLNAGIQSNSPSKVIILTLVRWKHFFIIF